MTFAVSDLFLIVETSITHILIEITTPEMIFASPIISEKKTRAKRNAKRRWDRISLNALHSISVT